MGAAVRSAAVDLTTRPTAKGRGRPRGAVELSMMVADGAACRRHSQTTATTLPVPEPELVDP